MWMYFGMMDKARLEVQNRSLDSQHQNGSLLSNSSLDANQNWDYMKYNEVDPFEMWVGWINKFGMPVIIFGGVIGNALSLTVFVTSHLRLQSCSMYLAFLNVVDSVFLLCLLTGWLGWFQIYLFHVQGWCQTIIYLSYVASFLSAWGVVCFTVERYIVVYHPLHKQVFCTRYKAIVTVVCLTIGALVFYSFALFIHGIIHNPQFGNLCLTYPGYDQLLRVMTAVDTVITLMLPSVVIVILNIAIVIKVWDYMMTKHHISDQNQGVHEDQPVAEAHNLSNQSQSSSNKSSKGSSSFRTSRPMRVCLRQHSDSDNRRNMRYRTTRSLLIVSSVFVALNMPSHSLRIHMVLNFLLHTDNDNIAYLQKCQQILQFLSYMNYSANFLLYCACSWGFRSGLRRLYGRMKRSYHRSKISFFNLMTLHRTQTSR